MAIKPKKVVGENVLDKVVRLLKEFNDRNVAEGADAEVELHLSPNGAGQLVYFSQDSDEESVIYNFSTIAELIHFLQMSPIDQMREIRDNV